MNTLEAIKARKSARSYKECPVEREKLKQLVTAAHNAPSACPLHLSVVENREVLKTLNDAALAAMKASGNEFLVSRASLEGYQPLYGAPALLLISAPKGAAHIEATASCAAANVTVAAAELGLGSCYVIAPLLGLGAVPALSGRIGIPEGYAPVCGVLLGYADGDAFSVPKGSEEHVNYCR